MNLDDIDDSVRHFMGNTLFWSLSKLGAASALESRLNPKKSLKDDLQLASKNVATFLKVDLEDLRQLVASIVTPYPDPKVWSLVYDCVNFALAPALVAGKANQAQIAKNLKSLYTSWTADYYGDANKTLMQKIQKLEETMSAEAGAPTYYCKLIPILQSSGMGKSRLVNEIGKDIFTISFTLRSGEESGYPPGDPEITRFLDSSLELSIAQMHARAVALISASFEHCTNPITLNADGLAAKFAMTRSSGRKDFCTAVQQAATATYYNLVSDQEWLSMFNSSAYLTSLSEHPVVRERLLRFCRKITKARGGRTVLLVFDEVSRLFPTGYDENFATAEHMTKYGRPMLYGYRNEPPEELRAFLLGKLLCVRREPLIAYNPQNSDHVFAVVAARVALDPCLNTAELSRNAVNKHLRLVLHLDTYSDVMRTTTLGEPIISEATAWLLMRRAPSGDLYWSLTIQTLVSNLLYPGLIEKGLRRELYFRAFFVLARDFLLNAQMGLDDLALDEYSADEDDPPAAQEDRSAKKLKFKGEPSILRSRGFHFASSFKLLSFIEQLFGQDQAMALGFLTGGNPRRHTKETPNLSAAFKSAWLNFLYFTTSDRKFTSGTMPELLHSLLHAHAALQFCFNQDGFDILIPIYLGDPEGSFDDSKVTGLMVQVKNKKAATTFVISDKDISDFFGSKFENPILFLLVDIGIDTVCVKGVETPNENAYGVYASGLGAF
ncbi:hypothetical protein K440DRAFT_641481 [Wilcoxina mikolae CBS 423.85]|nr:hypothetical protein K440DRAFT_641481 [Wilcoxina mikolae CBS 423.85]